jgi:hypothetical protein
MTTWRDQNRRMMFELGHAARPKTVRCYWCRAKLKVPSRGRLPQCCSATGRQRAYQKRKWSRPGAVEALAADLAHVKVRSWLRKEIRALLVEAGLVPAQMPLPAANTRRSKNHLRLVPPRNPNT